ncbi:ATP-dependent DNA helicase RecG [Brevibacterium daeguense]|uniref:ATP-dependent DNA helicase RecG n=1 Tax=Brevibacterium daeguense TaxID=909936 RepID=A0ABP8EM85_9MICO|nr:ATP-dependent DNA helicase RecG [Brevibacterium daeguense]
MVEIPLSRLVSRKSDVTDLERLELYSVEDALRYFPRTYLNPGELTPLDQLQPDTTAVISATVVSVTKRQVGPNRRQALVDVLVSDGLTDVHAPFFNQPWLAAQLRPGRQVALIGKVKLFRGEPQISSPRWLNPTGTESLDEEDLSMPIPIYRATGKVTTTRIQRLLRVLLDTAPPECFADPIAEEIRAMHGLPDYRTALEWTHRPSDADQPKRAMERWKFEEAYALQTELLSRKAQIAEDSAVPLEGAMDGALMAFDSALPYELTGAQKKAALEISVDLASGRPMNRLLHGDVGSGKTLVALRAMLQAVDSGAQAAMLAPTEVLAAQHHQSLLGYLGELGTDSGLGADGSRVRIALLTGSLPAKERRQLLLELVSGQIDIVVGTHALLSETTMFARLGLIVVDEQHRFGVRQREALRSKGDGQTPHALVMTATPIPRTVAMTVFGDLDTTVLDEMPNGSRNITTHAVSLAAHPRWLERIWEVVGEGVERGEQAFVVASRIDTQEPQVDDNGVTAPELLGVEDLAEILRAEPKLVGRSIETLHGRLDPVDKDAVMSRFASGATDVLVATTVIEVGIDVPNARTIVIYDADRFGVAQLHQLRGRVGRDGSQAVCFLVTQQSEDSPTMERLEKVAGTLDGFALAVYDVEQRREGDVLGRSQWGGSSSLRYLSVIRDENVILAAREAAEQIVLADPRLTRQPELRRYIDRILVTVAEDWIEAG